MVLTFPAAISDHLAMTSTGSSNASAGGFAANEPSVDGLAIVHHPAQRSGHADAGTHAHNTLSADIQDVHVFYPFHPLHGATLHILRRPKRGDGAVCASVRTGFLARTALRTRERGRMWRRILRHDTTPAIRERNADSSARDGHFTSDAGATLFGCALVVSQ